MLRQILIALIALAVLLPLPAAAQWDNWTTPQVAMGVVALAAHAVDWSQTITIARNPDVWYETNPLLGRHPTVSEVNRHFLLGGLAVLALAAYLPEYRLAILGAYAALEIGVASNNARLGIRMAW